ncbi:gfo/Idh/MocA family oxidoreductase [Streptomyces dangxiongensis]|uniref:Gfo/Idh/MocA family oxidoreductase n=1 Tax=Streptomyces dangxiongensis TaxID=1442032 RepID=A0A3G2JDR3_9ACTN|nr:Gfo/Idh/MocA family oxidoreductase [Streptomyces dangxiongensis]AYN40324.1 gfo/Idh/MocA family oxidoreductase [Streptomyces dangxiongensis]
MRAAVVGLGWVAREVWVPRLLRHDAFELVAVVEPDAGARERAGALPDGVRVHHGHEELDAAGTDVVFVLTPNHLHGAVAGSLLRRGVDVFLEKPTATEDSHLALLRDAAGAGGGRLVLSTAARHRGDVGELARLVDGGFLGTPRLAELSWVRSRGVPGSGWFRQRRTAGGGVLVDLGWHLVDVLHHLWGPSAVRDATAVASSDFLGRAGSGAAWHRPGAAEPAGGDVEDQLTALVAAEDYAVQLRLAWASHAPVDTTRLVLHGTEGTAELTTTFGFSTCRVERPTLTLARRDGVTDVPLPGTGVGDEYDRQLDALPEAFARTDATAVALREATDALAVVDACYRAAGLR